MDDNLGGNPFDQEDKPRSPLAILSILGAGLIACCIVFMSAFYFFKPDQLSLSDRYFPSPTATFTPTYTPTPTITPSPTITPTPTLSPTPTATPTAYLLIPPVEDVIIVNDQFDSNELNWDAYYGNNEDNITDGKLQLKSNENGFVGLALCHGCPLYDKAFYYQADVSPGKETNIGHGLAFCATAYSSEYYAFHISSKNRHFNLYKNTTDGWVRLLTNVKSEFIYKYPSANTLGVQFDQGHIQLYINGNMVNSYTDPFPIKCRRNGIFIDGGLIYVIADNVYAYSIEPTPVTISTP